ncbi:MAG TPA: PDDEXK nuclease domain-containing protein [Candidatus Kapabacteria bacterium]|nr:PDDEXK nuclease domain-containing protein [Candidatus Kapabacteria bacterium]
MIIYNEKPIVKSSYDLMLGNIVTILEKGRKTAYTSVNNIMLKTYWEIGREIVEFEQKGKEKAEYGSQLLDRISQDLKSKYGKGFSRSNVIYMRLFYLKYPKSETLSHQLNWSHYFELMKIDDDLERSFYEKQSILENWSVRELKRQKNTALFQRIALNKDKEEILELSKEGNVIKDEKSVLKDPYVFEFLNIPEHQVFSETHLEKKLIDNLQEFLLELGKGFAYIGRQYRISLANTHFYVDLVFYHRILKCFVLIDLKVGEVNHTDIGQMNMYLNYFKREENVENDSEPVGIILSKYKDDVLVEYATGSISNKLFVSKYQTYLPEKKVLQDRLKEILEENSDYHLE